MTRVGTRDMGLNSRDYQQMAQGLDDMRELTRAMVAGFMSDGFTEEQARIITTGAFASMFTKAASETEEES